MYAMIGTKGERVSRSSAKDTEEPRDIEYLPEQKKKYNDNNNNNNNHNNNNNNKLHRNITFVIHPSK